MITYYILLGLFIGILSCLLLAYGVYILWKVDKIASIGFSLFLFVIVPLLVQGFNDFITSLN